VEEVTAAIAATDLAHYLRHGRWSYAVVNALHILGIALLVGAVAVLDLRLLGLWRGIALDLLARPLVATAATGLALAILAGLALFAVRADEYAAMPLFGLKMLLVAAGTLSAIGHHLAYGRTLERAPPGALRIAGAVSLLCWTGALLCGRLLAFTGDN
jgi:hypothetical protein